MADPVPRLLTWPAKLPTGLDGLYAEVATRLGSVRTVPLVTLADLTTACPAEAGRDAVVVVVDAAVTAGVPVAEVLDGLALLADTPSLDLVLVVGDGWLGTDRADLSATSAAGAAVATARSVAVRRGGTSRPNVVCVPDALFGREGAQRGPLRTEVGCADVANAVAFLLGPSGGYLSGQVLFVNGGRQLFSSMTA